MHLRTFNSLLSIMSYLHKPHSKPLEHRTPIQLLHAHVHAHPHKEAFVFRDEKMNRVSLTFQEYERKSRFLAGALLEIGLVRGDRVLVMLPTSMDFVLVHMALNRVGVNTIITEGGAFHDVDEVKNVSCVIAGAGAIFPNHNRVMEEIQTSLDENKLKAAVMVSPTTGPLKGDKVYLYEKLFEMGQTNPGCDDAVQRAEDAVEMDDPTLVVFTSGTTSLPKPMQYTNHGYINGAFASVSMMTFDKDTIYFTESALDKVSGLCSGIAAVIAIGSTMVFFPPKHAAKGGMVPTIMKIIEQEGCTHALFFMYLLHDLTECNEIHDFDLSKFKKVVTGGQPTPVSLLKNVLHMLPHLTIVQVYGATEMNTVLNEMITKDNIDSPTYGALDLVDGAELKIVDENGQIVPHNVKGELCVRSAWVSFCNWDVFFEIDVDPSTGIGKNGWHFSKDLASMDQHGKVRLHGRMKDVIKCIAMTVSPYEIEDLLLERSDVKKVCVIGVPDQRLGQKICACIVLKDGYHSSRDVYREKELDDWCKDRCRESSKGLAMKPHYYVFVESFPLTRTGKVNRRLVEELAIKKLGL